MATRSARPTTLSFAVRSRHGRRTCGEIVADGRVDIGIKPMLDKWEERNVTRFGQPRTSGDDCQETIEAQLAYLCDCGFRSVAVPWHKWMWAVLEGVK